jgi:ABC-type lipoprotein export system ATPase subunit
VIVVTHDERALDVFDTLYDMEDGVIQPRLVSATSKGVPA